MLEQLYLTLCDMALPATAVLLAVLLLRLLLHRAPRIFSYALWAVVLFRLLCPVSIPAPVGLTLPAASVTDGYTLAHRDISPIEAAEAASRVLGDALNGGLDTYHHIHTDAAGASAPLSATWTDILILFGGYVWAAGVLVMLLWGLVSLLRLRRRLAVSVRLDGNVYLADHLPSPCVVGLLRPRIYLPSSLAAHERDYILMHERHHIRRGDHIWRLLGYLALCLHWANPLVWLAYSLSGRDMETSCDEAVMRRMDGDIRADYAQSLLSLSTGRRHLGAVPLYFGEGDTGARVRRVLRYQKPLTVVVILAALVLIAATLLLATTATSRDARRLYGAVYTGDILLYDTTDTPWNDTPPTCTVTADLTAVRYVTAERDWGKLALRPYPLERGDISLLMRDESGWQTAYRLPRAAEAYIAQVGEQYLIVAQTVTGDTLLGEGSHATGLTRLMRLRSCFADSFDTGARPVEMPAVYEDYPADTIAHVIGADEVRGIGRGGHDGYLIYGFVSRPHGADALTDMGFAVFALREQVGYRLIEHYVYKDAAVRGEGILRAPDLAVAAEGGIATRANSYEVLLIANERFHYLERRTRKTETVNIVTMHTESEDGGDWVGSMLLFPRKHDPIGQDIFMTLYDIDGDIMVVDAPARVSVTRVEGNTSMQTIVLDDHTEALSLVKRIDNFPYLDIDHPIYGGYDWHDGFIVRVEYVIRDDLVLHDDMRDCFVFMQDGSYYLSDRHHDHQNRTIREIPAEFYHQLAQYFAA